MECVVGVWRVNMLIRSYTRYKNTCTMKIGFVKYIVTYQLQGFRYNMYIEKTLWRFL